MNVLFQNSILFFRDPKTLFGKLKETPDLKRSFIIFALIICFYYIGSTKIAHVEIGFTIPEFISLLVSLAALSSTLFLSVIYESFYFFLFCRFLGRKIKFGAILSSVIYCSIPLTFLVLLRPWRFYKFRISPVRIIKSKWIFFVHRPISDVSKKVNPAL